MDTIRRFIVADNQDITRMGMHAYINSLFPENETTDAQNKKELLEALV
jgi:hypothetical protein